MYQGYRCLAVLLGLLLGAGAFAQDASKLGWELNLKRLALDLSSTDVKNAKRYKDFSNSRLTADSETLVKGNLDLQGNYFRPSYVWGNELFMEYGKTTLKPYDGEKSTNETADMIQFTTSYTQRLWKAQNLLGGFEAGPYASLAYQTEFNSQSNAPLKKVMRGALGVKIYEGKYIKNFRIAGFAEEDYTYSPSSSLYGWETAIEINQPVREGVKAVYSGLFRNYLSQSPKRKSDLDYEAELNARLDVEIYKNLAISPIIKYYTAQARAFGSRGQNFYVGVSLSFSQLFVSANKAK